MMHRWDVTVTHRITREKINTFTWGETRGEAIGRMREQFKENRETWGGHVFHVATLPATLQYSDEQIADARLWLTDCEWGDLSAEDIKRLTPLAIVRGVQRHYGGGWNQFIADMEA